MKTLLVLAEHPDLADALQSALDPAQYRVVHRVRLEDAEPLLVHGLADASIIDSSLNSVQGLWLLDKVRRLAGSQLLIVYTGERELDLEEAAYLKGATHVLTKPVRPQLLTALLDRLWAMPSREGRGAGSGEQGAGRGEPALAMERSRETLDPALKTQETSFILSNSGPVRTLSVLRDFSAILTHSLNSEAMLRQFLLLLRDILSVNRAAIFLRQPWEGVSTGAVSGSETRRLRAASSIGLSPALLHHLELSFDSGIGKHLARLGRILRRSSEDIRLDIEAQKEFELLGAQVAIPILDRDSVIGVALFDGRITGEALQNPELELIFHLLEQLGLAIKNIWLHEQVASNHTLMTEILRELSSACIVVGRDLSILHANKMGRKHFGNRTERRAGELEFTDLPAVIASKIYQVLKTGAAISNFRFEPEDSPRAVFNISVVPFQRQQEGLPASALMIAEDLTQTEQLRGLEVETAKLRLVVRMSERLTNEINNALVPISTYLQLLDDKWQDREFRRTLKAAMTDHVSRVGRLASQTKILARESLIESNSFPIVPLIEEAFQDAAKYDNGKGPKLKLEPASAPLQVTGERNALKHALVEVFLNALQANPNDPSVSVRVQNGAVLNGGPGIQIDVQDNGTGFSPEALLHAMEPFFTTRIVGIGLGLTVSSKAVGMHRGKLELVQDKPGGPGLVRIILPAQA